MHALDIHHLRAAAARRKPGYVEECVKRAVQQHGPHLFIADEDYRYISEKFAAPGERKTEESKAIRGKSENTEDKRDPFNQGQWPRLYRNWAKKRIDRERGVGDTFARLKAEGIIGDECGCREEDEIELRRKLLNRAFPYERRVRRGRV